MAYIKEEAYQIARYLYDKNYFGGPNSGMRGEVRAALSKIVSNFDDALTYLEERGWAADLTMGGDYGISYLTPAGSDFVENANRERINIGADAEYLLAYLVNNQTPRLSSFDAQTVMKTLEWDMNYYLNVGQILADEEYIKGFSAENNPFWEITLLPEGRKIVRNNFHRQSASTGVGAQTGNITVNNTGSNNQFVIGSRLTNVTQSIQNNKTLPDDIKDEIQNLVNNLIEELQKIPEENRDDAEAVAEMAKSLVENATKERPNKRIYEITVEGLKKAASNIASVTPQVLTTVLSIISFIEKLP
ncbi:MAG: hypothetical protein ACYC3P_09580 [Bellilinea sp.]